MPRETVGPLVALERNARLDILESRFVGVVVVAARPQHRGTLNAALSSTVEAGDDRETRHGLRHSSSLPRPSDSASRSPSAAAARIALRCPDRSLAQLPGGRVERALYGCAGFRRLRALQASTQASHGLSSDRSRRFAGLRWNGSWAGHDSFPSLGTRGATEFCGSVAQMSTLIGTPSAA
jgi:hypothetical protein